LKELPFSETSRKRPLPCVPRESSIWVPEKKSVNLGRHREVKDLKRLLIKQRSKVREGTG